MRQSLSRTCLGWIFAASALLCVLSLAASALEIHAPATVAAGQQFTISLGGSGSAAFYLVGPDHILRRNVDLGSNVQIDSSDVQTAGRYKIILCADSCTSAAFDVTAAQPATLSFFLHPSRVPISSPDSINGFAFVFDKFSNLVWTPVAVDFQVKAAGGAAIVRKTSAHNGVAWLTMGSTPRGGPVKVTAEIGESKEARVVQQVAAEACGLRIKTSASENRDLVTIETDPVLDCSGNPLPDGTIVSFTKVDGAGRSTVDVPIKKDVARTQFKLAGSARVSIACGVVLGNELDVKGSL